MPGSTALRDQLIAEGRAALTAEIPRPLTSTGDTAADALVRDIDAHPHALVCAILVNRQVSFEVALRLPALIRERHGSFEFSDLVPLDELTWSSLMRNPWPAHRFPADMARVLHRAVNRIGTHYDGDAARIWTDRPSSATLVRRFLEFHGAGPKIATLAANILVRAFRVELADYRYIDISADRQVCRVMGRLGLTDSTRPDVVVYVARDLHPDFPGIFDLALWDIGRRICRPTAPLCHHCHLRKLCQYANTQSV